VPSINTKTFDLNLLAVFTALWDTRSVTRAGERLALTQPAVSHALRRLRQAVGDELFVSGKGGLVPTPRGETLIGPVREALEQINQALRDEATFVYTTAQREFNIAAGDLVEFSLMPALIEYLGRHAPGIVIRLNPVPECGLAQRLLESGELDAVLCARSLESAGIHSEVLMNISLTILIRKQENLQKVQFPLSLYLARPHVVIRMPDRQLTIVDQTLSQYGLHRKIGAVVQNFTTMPMIAARTGYVCNVPSLMAGTFAQMFDLTMHEPPLAFDPSQLHLSWHRRVDADPAHAWLLDQIRSTALAIS
jgi:DNA-binding transcriptional LysR family regulator